VEEGVRHKLDKGPLEEFASSIARYGVLQPLVVEPYNMGRYRLKIGNRRIAASKLAGLDNIPAIILDAPLRAENALAIHIVENLHREDLDPIDEVEAYTALREMGVRMR